MELAQPSTTRKGLIAALRWRPNAPILPRAALSNMRVLNLTPFVFGYLRTSRRPPAPDVVLVVKASLPIVPGGVSAPESMRPQRTTESVSGDTFDEAADDLTGGVCVYPSDLAELKLNAEVMLRGTCHAPEGKPVTMCPVQFRVGDWSKNLRIVGPRIWAGDSPGPAGTFTSMPIGYENAFGGADYDANPCGKGFASNDLPNVESASDVIRSRADRPPPAGYGPTNPTWAPRRRKLGKHESPFGREFHGPDFDWTFFHSAPADQQWKGFLRGDELIALQNLHPTIPIVETRLPSLRVRAFVNDIARRFREVTMNLDTLYVDAAAQRIHLVWRGVEPVKDIDLADVSGVLFACEPLSATPLSADGYRQRLDEFEKDPKTIDHLLSDDERDAMARAKARAPRTSASPEEPSPGMDVLPPEMRTKLAGVDPSIREKLGAALASVAMSATARGIDLNPHVANATRLRAGAQVESGPSLDDLVKKTRRANADAGREEPEELIDYEKAKTNETAKAHGFRPERTESSEPRPGADLSGQDFSGVDWTGKDLRGANLSGAILANAKLAGANLTGANLSKVTFAKANLDGAILDEADLTQAVLDSASAKGARFTRAKLTMALFTSADLGGAVFTEATGHAVIFAEAKLRNANLERVRFEKIVGHKASFVEASFANAELVSCVFSSAECQGATFRGATLEGTSFVGANLEKAVFIQSKGQGTAWNGANATETNFGAAALPGAIFAEAKCDKALFVGADLRDAHFQRASLGAAGFERANLFAANLTRASIERTRFIETNLYGAQLVMVRGRGYDTSGANMKRTVLEPARGDV